MFKSFLILDLPINASDENIRKKYLELVKKHPPEKDSEQFHKITAAYEEIKDQRSRVKSRLFTALQDTDVDETLETLAASAKFHKKNVGLKELLQTICIF